MMIAEFHTLPSEIFPFLDRLPSKPAKNAAVMSLNKKVRLLRNLGCGVS